MARQAVYQQAPLVDAEGIGPLESELPVAPARSTLRRKLAAAIGLLGIGAAAANLLGRSGPSLVTSAIGAVTELAEDPCKDFPTLAMKEILHNNLGGQGPDKGPEGMVFKGVETEPGKADVPILMVVNASGSYTPSHASDNGFHGKYMTINLKGNRGDTAKGHLKIRFLDPQTSKPKKLHEVDLTFFDLDTASGGANTEYVMAKGFQEYACTEKTELKISKDGDYTVFKASTRGTGSDNPRDPNLLTLQQRDRAVMMKFIDVDHIEVEVGSTKGPHPRYFTFVGRPSLECGKVKGGKKSTLVKKSDKSTTTTTVRTTTTETTTTKEEKKCLFVIQIGRAHV